MKTKAIAIILGMAVALLGCTSVPKGLEAVSDFDADRYLGTWYEIALWDGRFLAFHRTRPC